VAKLVSASITPKALDNLARRNTPGNESVRVRTLKGFADALWRRRLFNAFSVVMKIPNLPQGDTLGYKFM
jgi:hypothetical protein